MTVLKTTWGRYQELWERHRDRPLVRLAVDVTSSFVRTNASQMAAGVALFVMLSLLPLLVVMVSVVPLAMTPLLPHYDIRQAILRVVSVAVSPVARNWVGEVLNSLARNGVVVDGLSLLTFVWAASGAFYQLDKAFTRILKDEEESSSQGLQVRRIVVDQIRQRRNTFLLFGMALATFLSWNFIGVGTASADRALKVGPGAPGIFIVASVVNWVVTGVFLAILYRGWLPGQVVWRGCILGAAIASAADHLVRLLVTNFIDTTIGATAANVGGPLALMLGVYLTVQNILLGAIIARQYTLVYAPET